jgi:tRNA threonylcarbamoyladenosine modification (KEOPS) complex Cgi121 subunit
MRLYHSGEDPAGQLKAFRKAALGAYVQTLDPSAVGGRMHILLTLKQTEELKASSQLLADKAEVDFLLRVAGTKQISAAVKAAGSKPGADSLLVVFGREDEVCRGLAAISRIVGLRPFSRIVPGRKAALRIRPEETGSVIGGDQVVARLLAEKAALLRR